MPAPDKLVVIGLRRLGDLLLATALIRSLRTHWPKAQLDALVAHGSAGILAGNPDVDTVIPMPRRIGAAWVGRHLLGTYDLSVSLQPEDRAQFLGLAAARKRASIVPVAGHPGARWKRMINQYTTPVDLHTTHAVIQYLQLADALGVPRVTALVPPRPIDAQALQERLLGLGLEGHYAVVHPRAMYRYKNWTLEGWRGLIGWLSGQGLQVAITGGGAPQERAWITELLLALRLPAGAVVDLCGRLSFAQLTPLLESACIFVGPDTSVTHLAAIAGTPTVAIFGPSNPMAWGPWPRGCDLTTGSPWVHRSPLQQRGNVWILQGIRDCVPCLQEGCERFRDSRADCLDQLPLRRVVEVARSAL